VVLAAAEVALLAVVDSAVDFLELAAVVVDFLELAAAVVDSECLELVVGVVMPSATTPPNLVNNSHNQLRHQCGQLH